MAPTPIYPNSKVAAGSSNTGGLTAWELIKPTNDRYFFPPIVFSLYDPGQRAIRLTGTAYYQGFPVSGIKWPAITELQWYYLFHTLLGDEYSGPITIKYRQEDPNTYVIANSTMILTPLAQSRRQGRAYGEYVADLTRLEVIG